MQEGPFGTLPGSAAVQQVGQTTTDDPRFRYTSYLVRKKFAKLVGASFYVDDPSGSTILYAEQKAFKLKEDLRLYTGEDKTQELLVIKARNILDISATYDVTDAAGNKLGALKRRGLKSMVQDEWAILDNQDREMGIIKEESLVLALIRRFIEYATFFLPQSYDCTIGGRSVATFKQSKNLFLMKINADFSADTTNLLDRRLGIAAAIMLCAIEGKQR